MVLRVTWQTDGAQRWQSRERFHFTLMCSPLKNSPSLQGQKEQNSLREWKRTKLPLTSLENSCVNNPTCHGGWKEKKIYIISRNFFGIHGWILSGGDGFSTIQRKSFTTLKFPRYAPEVTTATTSSCTGPFLQGILAALPAPNIPRDFDTPFLT